MTESSSKCGSDAMVREEKGKEALLLLLLLNSENNKFRIYLDSVGYT